MNRKIVTALMALAGLAALIYTRKKNRINEAAANAYYATKKAVLKSERKVEDALA